MEFRDEDPSDSDDSGLGGVLDGTDSDGAVQLN